MDNFRAIPVSVAFDESRLIGILKLTKEAIKLIEQTPEQVVTFSFRRGGKNLEIYTLDSAALIPNSNVVQGVKYRDMER